MEETNSTYEVDTDSLRSTRHAFDRDRPPRPRRRPDSTVPDSLHGLDLSALTAGQLQGVFRDPWLSYQELSNCRVAGNALSAIQSLATRKFGQDAVYIHPRVLAFDTEVRKVDWLVYKEDLEVSDVFNTFLVANKTNHAGVGDRYPTVWIAMFKTPVGSWVGDRNWNKRPWHNWAAAIMRGPTSYGKHVFFYDCDTDVQTGVDPRTATPKQVLSAPQRAFLRLCKARYRVDGVYLGAGGDDGSTVEEPFGKGGHQLGMCVGETLNWILKTALRQDTGYARGEEPWNLFTSFPKIVAGYMGRK